MVRPVLNCTCQVTTGIQCNTSTRAGYWLAKPVQYQVPGIHYCTTVDLSSQDPGFPQCTVTAFFAHFCFIFHHNPGEIWVRWVGSGLQAWTRLSCASSLPLSSLSRLLISSFVRLFFLWMAFCGTYVSLYKSKPTVQLYSWCSQPMYFCTAVGILRHAFVVLLRIQYPVRLAFSLLFL